MSLNEEEEAGEKTEAKPPPNNHITTFMAVHVAIIQQFSGINALSVYGTHLANEAFPEADYLSSLINF